MPDLFSGRVAQTRIAALVAVAWCGSVLAQAPAPVAVTKSLTVEIVVTDPGRKVPRVGVEGEPVADAFTMQGHALVWIVGKERIETPHEGKRAMVRYLEVRDNLIKDVSTGGLTAPPIRVLAGPGTVWRDILEFVECAYAAGFLEIVLPGDWREQPEIVPRGVTKPVTEEGTVVVPLCMYNEPDDGPPGHWRPEVVVHQSGLVTTDAKTVYEPGKDKDLSRLRKAVLAWEPMARDQDGLLTKDLTGSDNAIARTYVMIRADKWVEWSRVQAVMQECAKGEVVFSRFYIAVADKEKEASPKAAAPEKAENK